MSRRPSELREAPYSRPPVVSDHSGRMEDLCDSNSWRILFGVVTPREREPARALERAPTFPDRAISEATGSPREAPR